MTEPLAPLARFAFDWASTLCDPAHECMSYHRMWPLVRLLETDGALPAGEAFFRRQVAACARDGKVQALISGGADTGVMALAVEAALKDGIDIRVIAVDRCRTPLEQMRLYGAANGIEVATIQCSLDEIPAGLEADVILGHTILSFIPDKNRAGVLRAWKNALRVGGRICLSQRLAADLGGSQTNKLQGEMTERRRKLADKLSSTHWPLPSASHEKILDAAVRFWDIKMHTEKVTERQIRIQAESISLIVTQCEAVQINANVSPIAFNSFAKSRPRYEIVLEKPAV